jgi:hypothetical protein
MTGITPLLLLDEVVAHLDPGRRAALFDELANLGAQVWMTGPTLLRLPASGQAPTFSTSRPVRFRGGHNLKPQRNRPRINLAGTVRIRLFHSPENAV